MKKTVTALVVLVLSLTFLAVPVFSQDKKEQQNETKPQWSEVLGAVNCLNAKKERHIIRSDCDVTICDFPVSESTYVFVSCDSTKEVVCVSVTDTENDSCTEPYITE